MPADEHNYALVAYDSAGTGRRIDWPYEPRRTDRPIELWLGAEREQQPDKRC